MVNFGALALQEHISEPIIEAIVVLGLERSARFLHTVHYCRSDLTAESANVFVTGLWHRTLIANQIAVAKTTDPENQIEIRAISRRELLAVSKICAVSEVTRYTLSQDDGA